MKRIVLSVGIFSLLLTGCGSSNSASNPTAQTTQVTTTQSAPAPVPSAQPTKYAQCDEKNPPVGHIPVIGGTQDIDHTKMVCHSDYTDYVDLSAMINGLSGCKNIPVAIDINLGRPCDYPLRPEPNWHSQAYQKPVDKLPGIWSPAEGQVLGNGQTNPPLHIRCQVLGDFTRDDQGVVTNIWDVVDDSRLQNNTLGVHIGYMPDTVTSPNHDGGRGWRYIPCTPEQLKP